METIELSVIFASNYRWHKSLMTPAASQANDDNVRSLVGQPILAAAGFQPAFAGHESSLTAQAPPERRLQARLPAPHLFSRKSRMTPRCLGARCLSHSRSSTMVAPAPPSCCGAG